MDEFGLIARYFAPLATGAEALGLKDDAALLTPPPGMQLVITADALNAGVHFLGTEDPALIARKALRVNLSDLAAMGAAPWRYFLTLALPAATDAAWFERFAAGLAEDQETFGIALAGGDTTATHGPLSLSITALGLVPAGQALTRAGAQAGDYIYVSGPLGLAALGLQQLQSSPSPPPHISITAYLLPTPRIDRGIALRGIATACMDISDGLVQDLGHLCAASGVGAEIRAESVPRGAASLEQALSGGDDYELLFTLPPEHKAPEGCARIGVITQGSGVKVLDGEGNDITPARRGYTHF